MDGPPEFEGVESDKLQGYGMYVLIPTDFRSPDYNRAEVLIFSSRKSGEALEDPNNSYEAHYASTKACKTCSSNPPHRRAPNPVGGAEGCKVFFAVGSRKG